MAGRKISVLTTKRGYLFFSEILSLKKRSQKMKQTNSNISFPRNVIIMELLVLIANSFLAVAKCVCKVSVCKKMFIHLLHICVFCCHNVSVMCLHMLPCEDFSDTFWKLLSKLISGIHC